MSITLATQTKALESIKTDCIAVGVFAGEKTFKEMSLKLLDKAMQGAITDELKIQKAFEGKAGQTLWLHCYDMAEAKMVLLVGLGDRKKLDAQGLRRASAVVARQVLAQKLQDVTLALIPADVSQAATVEAYARVLTEGLLLGSYKFIQRRSYASVQKNKLTPSVKKVQLACSTKQQKIVQQGIEVGQAVANCTNEARSLVFDSPNFVTPTYLAEFAQTIAKGNSKLTCKVLDEKQMKAYGMGSLLGVAKGSVEPPKLIHLSYKPSPSKTTAKKKITLVGKGITFDSGGLSLKPAKSMELMKDDMAGAAAVLCVMKAISQLENCPYQVDVIVPTCENMPSGHAIRPGDILTASNGTTIEVNNTDAEGRLILCDALVYAQKETKPDVLIDLATLTGACVIALGKVASGMMGTDDKLLEAIKSSGHIAGEKFWQLPLYEEYNAFLKSDVADIINAGNGGEAGSQAGGMFLKHFIEGNQVWAHLDIAGPAYVDRDQPEVPKGATGVGVRTLLYYLYQWTGI